MNLQDTLVSLVGREGGYSNNPTDKGGETMWGITKAVAVAFGYAGSIALMPRETAMQIYRDRYWIQPGLDRVSQLNPLIAEELLDTGVNMGPSAAGKFLQRALNALNKQGTLYPDVTVDGGIGKMTLSALDTFLKIRGAEGQTVLLRMLNAQQAVRYIELSEDNRTQEEFEYGWQLNRVS